MVVELSRKSYIEGPHCVSSCCHVFHCSSGALDRCIEGSWAQAVLENTSDMAPKRLADDNPLNIHSMRVGGDTVTQVLLFDPQSVMRQLSRMHELEEQLRSREQHKAEAFRSYLSAKRQYNVGAGPMRARPVPSMQQTAQHAGGLTTHENERTREKLSRGIASNRSDKDDQLSTERTVQLISIVRLLLSCLHAWDLDSDLDKACICQLGLVKPTRPVSYGLFSRGHCLSLVLPGWGIHKIIEKDVTLEKKSAQVNAVMTAHQLRWQLSQSLTTQHLLTVVSITNTLMNQSFGARMLAKEGGAKNLVSTSMSSDDSDEEEDQGQVTHYSCLMHICSTNL